MGVVEDCPLLAQQVADALLASLEGGDVAGADHEAAVRHWKACKLEYGSGGLSLFEAADARQGAELGRAQADHGGAGAAQGIQGAAGLGKVEGEGQQFEVAQVPGDQPVFGIEHGDAMVDGVEGGLQQARLMGQFALAQAGLFGFEVGDVRVDAHQAAIGHAVFAYLQRLARGQLHLAASVLPASGPEGGQQCSAGSGIATGGLGQHVAQGAVAGVAGQAVELAEGLVAQQHLIVGAEQRKAVGDVVHRRFQLKACGGGPR